MKPELHSDVPRGSLGQRGVVIALGENLRNKGENPAKAAMGVPTTPVSSAIRK
ncbi:MAG: hypothetical protein WCC22_06730 [Terriglobales bacterium]